MRQRRKRERLPHTTIKEPKTGKTLRITAIRDPIGFYRWALSKARPVEVVGVATLPRIAEALGGYRAKMNNCHEDSFNIACALEDRGVAPRIVQGFASSSEPPSWAEVEGKIGDGSPCPYGYAHTWVAAGGLHFDLLNEQIPTGFTHYRAVETFTLRRYSEFMLRFDLFGDYLPMIYEDQKG